MSWSGRTLLVVALVGALTVSCGEDPVDPPDTDPCAGTCLPQIETCNEATGLCERTVNQDVEADEDDASDQATDSDASDAPDTVDEPDVSDLREDADDVSDLADSADVEEVDSELDEHELGDESGDADDSELDAADETSDPDLTDDDLAVDVADEEDIPAGPLSQVSALSVTLDLPEAVNIGWLYSDRRATGFVITQNSEFGFDEVTTLANPAAVDFRLTGLLPGKTYQIGVMAYIKESGSDRVDSALVQHTVTVPIPQELVLTPETSYLRSRPDGEPESVGQKEALYAALTYEAYPPVTLYRDGLSTVEGVSLLFRSDNEDVVSLGLRGVMTALDPGSATITASYDGAPDLLEADAHLTVVDEAEDDGTLIVNLSGPDDSKVQLLIEGPPSSVTDPEPPVRANQTLEFSLPPGRYEIEISSVPNPDFLEIRSVVFIRPGAVTSLERQLVRAGSCELIGESGGTVEIDGASLDIPGFAILEDTEVCLTALPSAASPWRGPSRYSPFLLPESFLITPRIELGRPASFEIDVNRAVSDYLADELENARLPSYSIGRGIWGLGPVGELESDETPTATVQLNALGDVVAFNACPEVGFTEGACRIVYHGCSGGESRSAVLDEPICGERADVFETVGLDTTVEDGDAAFSLPLGRAFSVRDTRSEFAICRAEPCPGGACNCSGEADSVGCGVAFSGVVESLTLDTDELVWESFASWDLFVPDSTLCETRFDSCAAGGDTCPDDTTPDCLAMCPWAPLL